jgi:hypothetical protein
VENGEKDLSFEEIYLPDSQEAVAVSFNFYGMLYVVLENFFGLFSGRNRNSSPRNNPHRIGR